MVGLLLCMFEVPQRQQLASEDSVPETPSYGTEWTFGTGNGLLWYATHLQRRAVPKAAPAAPDASSVRRTVSARRRANIKRGCSSKSIKTF